MACGVPGSKAHAPSGLSSYLSGPEKPFKGSHDLGVCRATLSGQQSQTPDRKDCSSRKNRQEAGSLTDPQQEVKWTHKRKTFPGVQLSLGSTKGRHSPSILFLCKIMFAETVSVF